MCGIIGYTGKNCAVPYLLRGLRSLEYRGYDSSGLSVCQGNKIETLKFAGKLKNLEEGLREKALSSSVGIGHTRWATHGKPDDKNAHPHESQTRLFSVVHNGIIENYASLKEKLETEGFVFNSETDTEVIAHLLEQNYSGNALLSLSKTISQLEGSFALAIICREEEGRIFCAAKESPLFLAKASEGSFTASDITALLPYSNEIYSLKDGELALLEKENISFYDSGANEIKKISEKIDASFSAAEKNGFDHFMLKEIWEQPQKLSDTLKAYIKDGEIHFDSIKISRNRLQNIRRIYLIGCGSAFHVALSGKYLFEKRLNLPCHAEIASEFRYSSPFLDESTLIIIISQSGETADSLAALRLAKEKNCAVISIVNVQLSTIAKESENVIFTRAGQEIAVATTKAYSCQLGIIYLLSAYLASCFYLISKEQEKDYCEKLLSLEDKICEALKTEKEARLLSQKLRTAENIFFMGRNTDYPVAMEGSLKLKEISYIHSEAYAAGELKHGTISLIEKGSIVVALLGNSDIFKKSVSNLREVKARGAYVIALANGNAVTSLEDADFVIPLPDVESDFLPSVEAVPLQLLSYYTALEKGCSIDKPRNLAKSVTVE